MNDVPTKTVAPIVKPEGEKEREIVLQGARRVNAPSPPPDQGVLPSWPPEDFSTQPEYALRELTQVPHCHCGPALS